MKTLLIDSSYLAHKARTTIRGLEFNNLPTGVLFGFFQQLLTVCNDPLVQSNQVHLFFDSRQSYRKESFPPYKEKRRKDRTPEEWAEIEVMQSQVKRLRKEILPSIGFPCYRQTGLESDDLIAQAAIQLRSDPCLIISSDHDLLQCISPNCDWYDPTHKVYLNVASMQHKYRVGPNDWAWVKSAAGCEGDGVPGIVGVGEKSAIDHIWKLIPIHHKRYQDLESDEGKAIIERNKPLVTLPHARTKPLCIDDPIIYRFPFFLDWAERLGFSSYLDGPKRRAWEMFFDGKFGIEDRQMPVRKKI